MKKFGIGILVLFFTYLLAACSPMMDNNSSFRLPQPTNIEVDRNIITFDSVEGASSYVLSINGSNVEITTTSYTFTEDGTYRVYIQAISASEAYADSLFTDAINLKVRFLDYPQDIGITNNQVSFTEDQDAQSYDVEIDGTVYNTLEDLPPYLVPGTYAIRVKARSDIYNESDFSPVTTVTVDISDRLKTNHYYQYSILSDFELPLYTYLQTGLKYIEIQETKLEKEEVIETNQLSERMDYYASNNTIYFSTSYLNYLVSLLNSDTGSKVKVVTFVIHTNLGDHEITLELNRLDTPYSYSGHTLPTNFKDDVQFGFETFDYEFIILKGHNIEETDYVYDDGILTIKAEFLMTVYTQKRSQVNLEFVVVFEKDKQQYEYKIYISK